MKTEQAKKVRLKQKQSPPGLQKKMKPFPQMIAFHESDKLKDKGADITGEDSGI